MSAFTQQVGVIVEEEYGYQDGADLCFNLMEEGVIEKDTSPEYAARIVAQHMEQA